MNSCNPVFVELSLRIGLEKYYKYLNKFGLTEKTGIDYPGEGGNILQNRKTAGPVGLATMSYGHGISVSLIQLARAYTVFARDGDMVPASLLRVDEPLVRGTPVYSAQTAREMRAMLELVVKPGGTAPRAAVPGYRVGGKTGTAHKLEGGVYAKK